VRDRANVVIPKIGYSSEGILKLSKKLNEYNYKAHLTLVNLDRKQSTLRALRRYQTSGRYVPLGLIFDQYSNDPILTYYTLKSRENTSLVSFGEISTYGTNPVCLDCINNNPSFLYLTS